MLKLMDLKSVKKFVLWLHFYGHHEYFRPQKINKWINVVMSNKVEHLELHFWPRKGNYELPSTVFTANNIKVLKLSGPSWISWWTCGVMVGDLPHVDLPLLEVLHLVDVKFSDVKSLGMLLSASPLLKHLVLKHLCGVINRPLDIGGLIHFFDDNGLDHLVTADVPQSLLPLKVFSNVSFLRFQMPLQHNLSPLSPNILQTFHNLTYLEFDHTLHDWESILKYLRSCPKLEILVIFQFACMERFEPTADVPHCVSSNLKELHLSTTEERLVNSN